MGGYSKNSVVTGERSQSRSPMMAAAKALAQAQQQHHSQQRTSFISKLTHPSKTISVVPFAPERLSITQHMMTPTMQEALQHAGVSLERQRSEHAEQTNTLFAALRVRRALQRAKAGRSTDRLEDERNEVQANVDRHAKVLQRYRIRRVDTGDLDNLAIKNLGWFMVDPNSVFFKLWQLLTLVLIIYQSLALPFALAFNSNDSSWFDYFTMIVFGIDILIQFNTPVVSDEDKSIYITNRREIFIRYFSGWFIFDLLACLPYDEIVVLINSDNSNGKGNLSVLGLLRALRIPRLLRLFRLLRLAKLLRIRPELRRWLQYSRHANLLRLFRLVSLFLVANHLLACVWWGAVISDETITTMMHDYNRTSAPTRLAYVVSFYTSLLLVMGQNITLATEGEYFYTVLVMLLGAVEMAVVFGNVSMLIANYYENQSSHQKKMESLFARMNRMKLPHELQNRINEYYQTMWERHGTLDGAVTSFIPELSRNLAYEVELFLRMDMINRAPIFQNCSAKVVQELVMELDLQVFMPGDYIVVRGEVGNDMYFVQSGVCEVTKDISTNTSFAPGATNEIDPATNEIILKTLGQGDYFGEIALLMNCKRTANVRARIFSELCTLTREVFESISLRYLEDRSIIEKFIMDKYDPNMLQAALKQSHELTMRNGVNTTQRPTIFEHSDNKVYDLLKRMDDRLSRLEARLSLSEREHADIDHHRNSHHESQGSGHSNSSTSLHPRSFAANAKSGEMMAFEPERVSQRNLLDEKETIDEAPAQRRIGSRDDMLSENEDGQMTEEQPTSPGSRRPTLVRSPSWRNARRDGSAESFRLRKLIKGPSSGNVIRRQSSRASSLTAAMSAAQTVPVHHSSIKHGPTPRGFSSLPPEDDSALHLTTDSLDHLASVLSQREHGEVHEEQ